MQDVTPAYSVVGGSEGYSVEQPEYTYTVINKPKKQQVSPEGPPCKRENLIASSNEEFQGRYQSEEGSHVYDQPDLSKKELPPQVVNGTETMNSSPNGESQELPPSEEIIPVYAQPDLSKKKHTQLMNTSKSTEESSPPISRQAEVL